MELPPYRRNTVEKYSVKTIKKNTRGSKEKIAIAGFGREGKSVLKFFLRRNRQFLKKKEVWILDKNGKIKVPRGVNLQTGKNYLKNIAKFNIIFRTPGIPYNFPDLVRARQRGVQISSATKLFFEHVHSMPMTKKPKIIGITGTKGKGTTSTLLYKILKAGGRDVRLAGNIGKSMLGVIGKLKPKSTVILEMSSFQLQDLKISPAIAVILDIFPDHQDSHLSLKEYYDAKSSIVKNQKKRDFVFFFKNNGLSRRTAQKSKGKKIAIDEKTFKLFRQEDLKIRGYHNFKNAVMAATVAQTLGVPDGIIIKAVKSFRGTEHRLELARKIKIRGKDGSTAIYFYNDSASTNPQTSAAAIKSFPGFKKILMAGGQDKNLDYKPLAEAVSLSGEKNRAWNL